MWKELNLLKLYDLFSGEDLAIAEKILQRRNQMLIHSFIYYRLNDNIISDYQWSQWAVELAVLQKEYPDIAKQVPWHEAFKDWDGSSGAFLPLDDEWVIARGSYLIEMHRKSR